MGDLKTKIIKGFTGTVVSAALLACGYMGVKNYDKIKNIDIRNFSNKEVSLENKFSFENMKKISIIPQEGYALVGYDTNGDNIEDIRFVYRMLGPLKNLHGFVFDLEEVYFDANNDRMFDEDELIYKKSINPAEEQLKDQYKRSCAGGTYGNPIYIVL